MTQVTAPTRWITTDPYHPDANAETFDLPGYLAGIPPAVLEPRNRRLRAELTRYDPLLFALLYLRHHIADPDTGQVTLAECHLDWLRLIRTWGGPRPKMRQWRHSFAAPRDSGKSTWWYTIAPIWGGAHGHVNFIAAFADSGTQAEMHLQTFRSEAQHNQRLRGDFPELCVAARKPTGKTDADNVGMFIARSGFVFAARGIGTATLGMKVGNQRPDVLICDDIEKDESSYGDAMIEKRQTTLTDAVFPLNERARVVIVGTATRPGSLVHQLVRVARGEVSKDDPETLWIHDERIQPHHYPPIIRREDGTERSIWPARWPLEYLYGLRGTRSYQKNFDNNPRAYEGTYWSDEDIRYGEPTNPVTRWFVWVDPPTTQSKDSDYAGVCIVGHAPPHPQGSPDPAVLVWHAEEIKLTGKRLGAHIAKTAHQFETDTGHTISGVIVEANQGGDLWYDAFDDLPYLVKTYTVSESKPVRFALALDRYQAGQVWHARELTALEDRMLTYPRVANDDIIDAVASGVLRLTAPPKPQKRSRTVRQR